MERKNTLIPILCCFFLSLSILSQEGKKTELLESRLLVVEDYLKSRLHEIQTRIQENASKIQALEENKAVMHKEREALEERLKLAEAEILNLKIALASLQKTQTPPSLPLAKEESLTETEAKEKKTRDSKESPGRAYRNPEIQALQEKLSSPLTKVRLGAILQLSKHPDAEADLALVSALSDTDIYNQKLACKALGKRKSSRVIEPLFQLLEKAPPEMVSPILEALSQITGLSEPFPHEGSNAEKKKAIQNWREKIKD